MFEIENKIIFAISFILLLMMSCNLPTTTINLDGYPLSEKKIQGIQEEYFPFLPQKESNQPYASPTPDPAKVFPPYSSNPNEYTIIPNDTLGIISFKFNTTAREILNLNPYINPNMLYIGQIILIPANIPSDPGPSFKIIPDSELVNGPINHTINLQDFIKSFGGYLSVYQEEVNGQLLSSWEIIDLIGNYYSVNPRLLLAVIEYQSQWLTKSSSKLSNLSYPMGLVDAYRSGLYFQTAWVADKLNNGYYLWKIDALSHVFATDGQLIPLDATINSGTAAIQFMFSKLFSTNEWRSVITEFEFFQTYQNLYGNPFKWAIEPHIPSDLVQPELELPFESNVSWYFTGGPHGAWDDGSAWAALDFAPYSEILGCFENYNWVVAMADGLIVISENGGVFQDLDGDGNLGTGWVLFYMHIGNSDRVAEGTELKTGERIGHPSCEGGISTGTHLHIARKYNGEWIAADGAIPFIIGGWRSVGNGVYYDGSMQNDFLTIPACNCLSDENEISK